MFRFVISILAALVFAIAQPATVRADLILNQLIGFGVGGEVAPPVTISYISNAQTGTAGATFNAGNFSAPTAGLMVVGVTMRHTSGTSNSCSSVSIGGSNGSLYANTAGADGICFAVRQVSSGNNNVTVTASISVSRMAVHVWLLTGNLSDVPIDTDAAASAGTATTRTITLDTQDGGGSFWLEFHENLNNTTWTNGPTVNGNIDVDAANNASGASEVNVGDTVGNTGTATWTTSNDGSYAGVSFR